MKKLFLFCLTLSAIIIPASQGGADSNKESVTAERGGIHWRNVDAYGNCEFSGRKCIFKA